MALRVLNNSSLAACLLSISMLYGFGPLVPEQPVEVLARHPADDPPDFLHDLLVGNDMPHTYGIAQPAELVELRRSAAKKKELLLLLVSPSDRPDEAYWGFWSVGPIGRYMVLVLWGWLPEALRPSVPGMRATGHYILITREQQAQFLAQEGLKSADMGQLGSFPH